MQPDTMHKVRSIWSVEKVNFTSLIHANKQTVEYDVDLYFTINMVVTIIKQQP